MPAAGQVLDAKINTICRDAIPNSDGRDGYEERHYRRDYLPSSVFRMIYFSTRKRYTIGGWFGVTSKVVFSFSPRENPFFLFYRLKKSPFMPLRGSENEMAKERYGYYSFLFVILLRLDDTFPVGSLRNEYRRVSKYGGL